MKSWKTSAAGIVAGVMLLLTQAQSALDDDPATNISIEVVVSALAMMGLGVSARDGDKSSQDHEIR